MAYIGGKSKCYSHITLILNDPKYDNKKYLEPFMGMCHILRRVVNKKKYVASDINPNLYHLLKGIQEHKKFKFISKEKYSILKNQSESSFEKSLAAFTYSYNGKEFGGYTLTDKNQTRNYPQERIRYYKTLQENDTFKQTKLKNCAYNKWKPSGYLIYCDPPYKDTTDYHTDFNHTEFWNTVREWSKNNTVFVSEYTAPKDFKVVSKAEKYMSLSGSGCSDKRVEKLFQYNPVGRHRGDF
jgi:DNA adenine methylase